MRYNTPLSCRLFSVSKAGRRRCAKRFHDRDIQNRRILSINLRNAHTPAVIRRSDCGHPYGIPRHLQIFCRARIPCCRSSEKVARSLPPVCGRRPYTQKPDGPRVQQAETAQRAQSRLRGLSQRNPRCSPPLGRYGRQYTLPLLNEHLYFLRRERRRPP